MLIIRLILCRARIIDAIAMGKLRASWLKYADNTEDTNNGGREMCVRSSRRRLLEGGGDQTG